MVSRSISLALAIAVCGSSIAHTAAMAKPIAKKVQSRKGARIGQPANTQRPTSEVFLSKGQGQMVTMPAPITDVWTSNPGAADVYVSSPRQIYVFGKEDGEATIYATTANGTVAYSTNVRVSQNLTSIEKVLRTAMPEADIHVTIAGQFAVLTGTVASPDDAEQAHRLVVSYLNPGVDFSVPNPLLKIVVMNRLKTATPLQVNLQVRIAEVNRSLVKEIGVNLLTRDTTGGFNIGVAQGRNFGSIGNFDASSLPRLDASSVFGLPAGSISLPFNPATGQFVTGGTVYNFNNLGLGAGKTAIGLAGKLFGLDVASALDLAETQGLVTTLAQPNLTALSGETASFLAGGEFPIPISQDLGAISIEYKQYGVSLAFTPTVLNDGRISMRVRPEVSELSNEGTIRLNGFDVPGITTRRAETTVELGSGQSFMIAGLLRNTQTNSIQRAPGLGNVPVLGSLFRSNSYRRGETELVIIITPYLVKPVSSPSQIALPTDGFRSATDLERVLLGKLSSGKSGEPRPVPTMAPPTTVVAPSVGALAEPVHKPAAADNRKKQGAAASPGFSGN